MKDAGKNKELIIYIAIAYGFTLLMGLLMWYGNNKNLDLSGFVNAQMFYPAAGVMTAVLCTRKKDALVPKAFYVFFICTTVILAVAAVGSILNPYAGIAAGNGYFLPLWSLVVQLLVIGSSIIGWVILLATKKEKRRAYNLCWNKGASSCFCIFLFMALYLLRTILAVLVSGELAVLGNIAKNLYTWIQAAVLPVNFFLVYTAFLGEEYGWRYYLQPLMQKRFGVRGGVLLLGVVWGIWHLPVDLFYYTQNSQLPMIAAQQITCITLGIFFAYAYMKTNNIWVPVALHYLNNNLVPIISGNYTSGVLENQTVTWSELLVSMVINGVIFGGFLLAAPFRKGTVS
ncbi:MAG: CPBP family intramembrane metalloprotease [Lachnospiraceae bacterium]|nr:CPBP family intramembrane metalloprotease [Lachnospiraceae bacterium]